MRYLLSVAALSCRRSNSPLWPVSVHAAITSPSVSETVNTSSNVSVDVASAILIGTRIPVISGT